MLGGFPGLLRSAAKRFVQVAVGVIVVPVPGFGERPGPARSAAPSRSRRCEHQKAARLWPLLMMPNSAACLIALVVSPPALARPIISLSTICACSRNDEKSLPVERMTHLAEHLAAVLLDHRRGIALERVPECVIGREEEPVVAAGLHHRGAGAVGEHPGVISPMHGVGRLHFAPVRSEDAAPDTMNTLFFVVGDLADRERDRPNSARR